MYITVYLRKDMEDISADLRTKDNRIECMHDDKIAAAFDLFVEKDGVVFGNVEEAQGYYLMSVKLNRLVELSSDTANFALPSNGGRLIRAEELPEGEYSFQLDSKNPLLVSCLYDEDELFLLESDLCENRFYYGVSNGQAFLSCEFIYHLSEYELAEYGHNVPAVSPDYYLKVQDSSRISLTTIKGDWRDAARLLQTRYPEHMNPYYADKIVGKILADNGAGKWYMTFAQIGEMLKRYAALMNYQPSVFYLVGWQFNGHDTGYPAIDVVNERLGGKDGLKKLMELGRELNIVISFHDNYDDAYKNSPDWREDMVSLDAAGELMKCGFFVQGQAYLLNNFKYSELVPERVRRTVELHGIRESYHIDVLSGAYKAGRRYDFNPQSPAGADKNLEGKLRVVDEFAKFGVDVTTEDFTSLMLGRVSHFWHMAFDRNTQPYETSIPFVPFVCHTAASWGSHGETDTDVCWAILNGACYSTDLYDKNFNTSIDMYYLTTLPWMKLYGKKINDYQKDGNTERIVYEGNSAVEVDMTAKTYRITVDNEIIAENYFTFVEQKKGVYLAYSRIDGERRWRLPKGLSGNKLCVEKLLPDGSGEETRYSVIDGCLILSTEAGQPYRITVK